MDAGTIAALTGAVAAAPLDAGTIAALIGIAVALSTVLGTLSAQLIARRSASGRISTSEASVLWQQSQEMRAMLLAEKDKAEEQRDRLIGSYTEQVLPALTGLNDLVRDLFPVIAVNTQEIRAIAAALRDGGPDADLLAAAALVPPDAEGKRAENPDRN